MVCTSTIGTWIGMAYSSSRSLDTEGRPPSARPRHHRRDRALGDDRRRHRAAIALHDEQLAREAAAGELALQAGDVAVQDRLDRGIDRRRRAALVLAVLGDDGVPRRDVVVRPQGAHDLRRPLLVRRVQVAVQEVDHHALGAEPEQGPRRGGHGGLVESDEDPAFRVDALVDLEAQAPLDEGDEAALEAVRRRPRPAAELEDVAEALRRDQADARDLALEHGVGRRRRAVHDGIERSRLDLGRVERGEDPEGLVVDGGRHLGEADLAGRVVDEDEVGEGAADVDARDPAHRLTGSGVRVAGLRRS
jgi:hypothetical protein